LLQTFAQPVAQCRPQSRPQSFGNGFGMFQAIQKSSFFQCFQDMKIWDAFGMHLGCIWDVIWDAFVMDLGMHLRCIWDAFGMHLGCIKDAFKMYSDVYRVNVGI